MKKFHAHCGILEASESKISTFISGCSTKSQMYFYGKIRQCHMKKDLLGLERLIDYLDKHELHPFIKMLGQLRLASLMEIACNAMITEVLKHKDHFPPLMLGEVYYVCAKISSELGEVEKAQEYFLVAQKQFCEDKVAKKSARAYFKWVQLEKSKNQQSELLEEHAIAYKWAKEAEDYVEAAKIALMLSKEYQSKTAFKTALQYVNYSCDLLEEHEKKSHLYFLALCQRCQVYIDLKIHDLAKKDYLKAASSHNKEVAAALKSISF